MRKPAATDAGAAPERPGQRLDKWLWHARFARTRTAAQRLVQSGHVRVNRQRAESAARLVRAGDVLTIALGAGVRVIAVVAIAERRGPAEAARLLYDDRTPQLPAEPAVDAASEAPVVAGPRPDRRARRAATALKRGALE